VCWHLQPVSSLSSLWALAAAVVVTALFVGIGGCSCCHHRPFWRVETRVEVCTGHESSCSRCRHCPRWRVKTRVGVVVVRVALIMFVDVLLFDVQKIQIKLKEI